MFLKCKDHQKTLVSDSDPHLRHSSFGPIHIIKIRHWLYHCMEFFLKTCEIKLCKPHRTQAHAGSCCARCDSDWMSTRSNLFLTCELEPERKRMAKGSEESWIPRALAKRTALTLQMVSEPCHTMPYLAPPFACQLLGEAATTNQLSQLCWLLYTWLIMVTQIVIQRFLVSWLHHLEPMAKSLLDIVGFSIC